MSGWKTDQITDERMEKQIENVLTLIRSGAILWASWGKTFSF